MSTDVVRIETVYEPGFGETGRQKLEDLVMFESPVGLIQLDIKERLGITKRIQEIAKKTNMRSSFQPMAMDLITFAEKGEASVKCLQAKAAIESASTTLFYGSDDYPSLGLEDSEGNTVDINPVRSIAFERKIADFTSVNTEVGKIPTDSIILMRDTRLGVEDYEKARDMIINEANKTLQLFGADFRIPQFPVIDKLKRI